MNSKFISNTTVKSLVPKYVHDKNLILSNKTITAKSGLTVTTNNLFNDAMDCKINDGDMLVMSDKKFARTEFTLDIPESENPFPYTFITYFVFSPSKTDLYALFSGVSQYPTNTSGKFLPQFVQVQESTDDTVTTRQYTVSAAGVYKPLLDYTSIPNNHLFQVELLDEYYCRITHNDGYLKTALTYTDTNASDAMCEFHVDSPSTNPTDPQVFMYHMQDNVGYMGLMKQLSDGTRTHIIHSGDDNGDTAPVVNGKLKGSFQITDNGLPVKALAKTKPNSRVSTIAAVRKSIDTMWYKYSTWFSNGKYNYTHQNTMEPDDTINDINGTGVYYYTNSYINLANNFLIDCQYTNISGDELAINITPLKNQLAPQGTQAENNPHATGDAGEFCIDMNTRSAVDFRTYQKIFNGTNQYGSANQLCMAYTAYTDKISFKSDKITYFHMPNIMKPYVWMNVNYRRVPDEYPDWYDPGMKFPVAVPGSGNFDYEDFVGLIKAGAVPGSAPINADKIFKKRADYRYFSHWGDSGLAGNRGEEGDAMFGTWLCAWLREGFDDYYDKKFGPMWMDRYYDDSRFSEQQVIGKPPNCINSGDFGSGVANRAFSDFGYFDIPSELRLERGVLYAYHHIGHKHTKLMIAGFSDFMFHEDINNFTQTVSGNDQPAVVRMEDDSKTYIFEGEQYGQGVAPDPSHGDFRLSFWMHSDDWTKQFGHQILGNYVNDGMAVTNNDVITPLLVFDRGDDGLTFTNTEGKTVTTINSSRYNDEKTNTDTPKTITHTRDETLGDVSIITSVPGYTLINRFDMNGTLSNTYTISGGLYAGKEQIIALDSMHEYVFTLFEGTSSIGRIDLRSGEFLDLDVTEFDAVTVSGVTTNTLGVSRDFTYTLDDQRLFNKRPVYVSIGSSVPYYFVYDADDNVWRITSDGENYSVDNDLRITTTSETPDNDGVFTLVSGKPGQESWEGRAQPFYADWKPPGTYIASTPEVDQYNNVIIQDSQTMFLIDADCVCDSPSTIRGGNNLIHFTKNGNVYAHNKALSKKLKYTVTTPVISGDNVTFENIKIDQHNNVWLLYVDQNNAVCVAKYDPQYNQVFNKSLDATKTSNTISFDIISEYTPGSNHQTYALLVDSDGTDTKLVTVGPTGEITTKETITGVDLNNNKTQTNFSNYNNINKIYKQPNNTLTFKFRAKNKYNQTDYVNIVESFDVSSLASGWHHFSFGFDANLKGIGYFYIDGMIIKERPLLGEDQLGKYGWTEVLSKLITIGATQGYNNSLLSTILSQPGYYYSKDFKIKNLRMYNFNLYRGYVKALAREHLPDHDMEWVIPSGRKTHLDHVEKIHMHRLPGNKSNNYDINLYNTAISGTAQQQLNDQLRAVITQNSPVNTNFKDLNWVEQQHAEVPVDPELYGEPTI